MALILAPPPTSKRETWNRWREKEEFENPIVGVIPSVVSVKKTEITYERVSIKTQVILPLLPITLLKQIKHSLAV